MGNRVFLNKQFSYYLGEQRAILDIVDRYEVAGPSPTPSITPTITPTPSVTVTPTLTSTPTPTPSAAPSGFNIGSGFASDVPVINTDGGTGYFVGGPQFYNGTFRFQLFHLSQNGTLLTDYQNTTFNNNFAPIYGTIPDGSNVVMSHNSTLTANGRAYWNKFDSSGNPVASFSGTSPNNPLIQIGRTSTGDFIAVGAFTTLGGQTQRTVGKTNNNGVGDATFGTNIGTGFNGNVVELNILPDDTILVAGTFTTFNGGTGVRLFKLNNNGTSNTTFNNNVASKFTAGTCLAITYDATGDTIYVGGTFTYTTGATTYTRIVALNGDGSLKTSFSAGTGFNNTVNCIRWDTVTNRLYVGGEFTQYKGSNLANGGYLCRLDASGNLDTTYVNTLGQGFSQNASPTTWIPSGNRSFVIDSNGDFVAAGRFTNFDNNPSGPGVNVNRIIKLDKDGNNITTT